MIKYTKKNSILLFCCLFLLSCTSKQNIIIRDCYSTNTNSPCEILVKNMVSSFKTKDKSFKLTAYHNFTNSYSSLTLLNQKKIDFAFILYELFQKDPSMQSTLQNITPLKKIFFSPLLFVVLADSPYRTLKDLKGKKLALGFEHDDNNLPSVLQILNNIVVDYTPVTAKEINYAALLDDRSIDMFVCFSLDCPTIIKKTSHIADKLRILHIEDILTDLQKINSPLNIEELDIHGYEGISNYKNIKVLGSWQYLVTRNNIEKNYISVISNALNQSINN